MIIDLGGRVDDFFLEVAMKELDTNKDGTCNFDEFKTFWSAKPELGGYNSMALRFLKGKIAGGAMLGKGKKLLGIAGANLTAGESTEDTRVKITSEVSPALQE